MGNYSWFLNNLFEKISIIKKLSGKRNFLSNILELNLKRFSSEQIKKMFKRFHLVRLKVLLQNFLKGDKIQLNLQKDIKNCQN
jgi:hypothetical protein